MREILDQLKSHEGDAYFAWIVDQSTGEGRVCDVPEDTWSATSWFWWMGGNMSCDCTRELIFMRAAGEIGQNDIPERECGDERFQVVAFEFKDGPIQIPAELDREEYP